MATELAKAYVQIVPSAEGMQGNLQSIFDGEADKAGVSAGKKFGGSMGSALGGALKTGVTAVAGLATAAVGAGTAFAASANSVAAYGDNIDKMSQKMGLTAEAYQEWDAVMQHSGTSMETMKASMKTLANAVEGGNEAFAELGITEEQLANMNQQEIFEATIASLQNVDDTTQRTYLAGKLLGRGATELGALLNTSAEDTQAMRDRVHELGGVMSDEAVTNSAAFKDSLQDLTTSFAGVKNSIMSEMLPSFTSVMDGFSSLITGEEGAQEKITAGMEGIVQNITEVLPRLIEGFSVIAQSFMEVAPELISTLAQGLLDALPTLLPSLIELVGEIGSQLIALLPQLVEVGLQVILELANGIAQALPDLIPTIVDVTLTIVETLIDNVDLLIDAAIAIIIGLAEGLINALPRLIEKIPVIVEKLVSALIENAPKLLTAAVELIVMLGKGLIEATPQLLANIPTIIKSLVTGFIEYVGEMASVGVDLVKGIWDGIKKEWENLTTNVKSLGKKLVSAVKGFFEIGSPSKLFSDEVGQWIPKGIAVGIDANADSVTDSIDNLVKDTMISPSVSMLSSGQGLYNPTMSASTNNTNANGILAEYLPLILNAVRESGVTLEGDARQIFNVVRKENNQYRKSHGGVSALI